MNSILRVAAIQMLSTPSISDNIAQAIKLIRDAVAKGAKLVCLPENFASFGAEDYRLFAEREFSSQNCRQVFSALANELDIYLLAGSMPVLDPATQKVFASSFLFNNQGEQIARYNKLHLFDAVVNDTHSEYRESDQYAYGEDVVCVTTPIANIGMAICYDLRFPELFQRLREQGANILMLPSAFTYATGQKHWETLLRARAIETQCFVVASNQGGKHSERRETWGHSMIVSPDGEILASAGLGEAVVIADIDFSVLQALRQRMPLWQHKKPFLR